MINADSAQVYRDLRILSARPSPEEEARVPHRLFGHVDGAEAYSAARWAAEAKAAIEGAELPILVGGTGMYLRTLLDGIAPVPEIEPAIRAEIRALPVAETYPALVRLDPEAAARLRPSDTTRVARALEVVRSTGKPLAIWQQQRVGGIGDSIDVVPLVLLPDRDWLNERIDSRLDAMFDGGAREEVEALLARGDVPDTAPVRRAIGVGDVAGWITGDMRRDEALAAAKLATRRYAKRQYTWFRHQPPAAWPRAIDPTDPGLIDTLTKRVVTRRQR